MVAEKVRKKRKDLLIKKRSPSTAGRWPGWSLVGRYISQDAGIHINQLAAVLQLWLWWKPLCCLGCKLRVHTESRALTLKGSKILILCVFHSPDMNMYYKAIKKKSIQMFGKSGHYYGSSCRVGLALWTWKSLSHLLSLCATSMTWGCTLAVHFPRTAAP